MTPSFDTLGNLRRRLAVRLGFGAQADALGIQAPILDDFLQSAQVYLCRIIRWRHLQCLHVEDLCVDQRVMDLPDDCLIDGIHRVLVLDAGVWREVKAGLPAILSKRGEDVGIPMRYEFVAHEESVGQLHFHPIPTEKVSVAIEYYASPSRFTASTDRASIPDDLIFLHALANAKAHYRQPDAQAASGQLDNALVKARIHNFGVDDSSGFGCEFQGLWGRYGHDYL